MILINKEQLEIKKSKFIAYYYEITEEKEAKTIIETLRKEHKNAKHFPFAYKVNNTARKSDDKEPLNTAGLPLYNLLEIKNLNNCLIVVVRYFGGIKLGAGGLTRAYVECAKNALNSGENLTIK